MTVKFFEETINGSTLSQMHDAAMDNLVRVYNPGGSVYVSRDDLDSMAWEAAMTVYEKKDTYVKQGKNACGLACTIAYNDLMDHLKKGLRKNMETVPMEIVNTEKGVYNTADTETGRKFTTTGIGVGREFDISSDEGMEIIEGEVDKLSYVERQIYEMMLDRVPQKVIAATLNLSHSNVRKKWHDIRKKLLRNKYIFGKLREMGLVG
jgi:DNA-directed RNA polymerase specialized sigma24 family protein